MSKECDTCKHLNGKVCVIKKSDVCGDREGVYPFWESKETISNNPPYTKHAYNLLTEAAETLRERGKNRDKGEERSMGKTVELFNKLEGTELSEVQGWRFMLLLKLVRQQNSIGRCKDSFIDAIGYAALMAEAAFNNKEK